MVMQLIFLSLTILFTSSLFIIPFNSLAVFERMAFLGVVVSGIALGFGLMLQFRVYEVEVNFELRLREALAEVKDWQA